MTFGWYRYMGALLFIFGPACLRAGDTSQAPPLPTPTFGPVPQSKNFHPLQTPNPGHVRLAFAGDINLGRRVTALLQEKGERWVFEAVKPVLDGADLVVANLESPVGDGGEEYVEKSVYLKGRPQDLDALSYSGLGLVTLSNNHVLDYGPEVTDQTVKGLEQRGILSTGLSFEGGATQTPVYVTVQGLKLAFLAYCSVCPEEFYAGPSKAGVEVALPSVMIPEIRAARKKADFVIVLIHWGTEYYGANDLQKKLATALHKGGADLVIGAHPHVLQKIQNLGKTLVAYSLGNYLFDLKNCDACMNSCVLMVDLEKGKKPQWKAVALDLSHGRPEPLDDETDQAKIIHGILKEGYEYNGDRNAMPVLDTRDTK